MAAAAWPGVRAGSTRVSVYNEGLLVFLWDEAHLVAMEASEADFEGGYADDDAGIDKALKKLARDGVVIAYELDRDDAVAAEVVVGLPLTKAELSTARWQKPQTARLSLPTGALRIDTGNTFPIGDEPDEDEEPGRVAVPPGDYVVTLYRLDWDRLETDGLFGEGDEWTGPQEVIVLTPAADAKPVKGAKPLLRAAGADAATWQGKYTIDGRVFHGKASSNYDREICFVNIDRPAVAKLGLNPGTVLRMQVGEMTLEAVYIGDVDPLMTRTSWVKAACDGRPDFGAAMHGPTNPHALVITREVASTDFPVLKKWVPATMTVLADQVTIPESLALTDDPDDIDLSGLE